MVFTDELYDKLVKLIYRKTGLYYEHGKKYYVQSRVEKRVSACALESINEYYIMLKFAQDNREFDQLINDLTINETYFFRDFPQLQNFAEEVLPFYTKTKRGKKKLKIWSAACSTGEEPYTLSIILLEMLEKPEDWDIQVLASDINSQVLTFAQTGLYESRAVKDVPEEYLGKYFSRRGNKYRINSMAKGLVTFKRINLMDDMEMEMVRDCDFIFCRNCLIYFDDVSRKTVLGSFYDSLHPGGFLFLGHSESVGRFTSDYQVQKMGDTLVYSKPQ